MKFGNMTWSDIKLWHKALAITVVLVLVVGPFVVVGSIIEMPDYEGIEKLAAKKEQASAVHQRAEDLRRMKQDDAKRFHVPPSTVSNTAKARLVTSDQYGDRWPLTVKEGWVETIAQPGPIVFHANGTVYALNGLASGKGFPWIDPIWRENKALPGTRIDISPLIKLGQSL